MRVARPLLVVELWPNSLTEYLGLQIWRAAGEDAARCQRAVALPTTIHHQPEAGLLIPVNQLRFAWWVRQGGRNAFNRDWSCCCGWAFARNHGSDPIGAGERRSHRSSRGRNGYRDPGALLVHVARLARLLPALAVLVRGLRLRYDALSAARSAHQRANPSRARRPSEPGAFFVRAGRSHPLCSALGSARLRRSQIDRRPRHAQLVTGRARGPRRRRPRPEPTARCRR